MRIEQSARVVYANNPLAEVVCQLRMAPLPAFDESLRKQFCEHLGELGYPQIGEEVTLSIAPQTQPGEGPAQVAVAIPQLSIQHFTSTDNVWRVSVCPEFVALTCLKYTEWGDFSSRLLKTSKVFLKLLPGALPARLGLRYKDVIEREPLGLQNVPWHELVKPFLLGPLAPNVWAEGQLAEESEVHHFLAQSLMQLDDCKLLLQSSLLSSLDGERKAFLIDADFFVEGGLSPDMFSQEEQLTKQLKALHSNAGALFRRCITERLHNALHPAI